jgi:hypothetical protein
LFTAELVEAGTAEEIASDEPDVRPGEFTSAERHIAGRLVAGVADRSTFAGASPNMLPTGRDSASRQVMRFVWVKSDWFPAVPAVDGAVSEWQLASVD